MKTRNEFKTYYEYLVYKKKWLNSIKTQLINLGASFFTIKQIEIEIQNVHNQINDQVW